MRYRDSKCCQPVKRSLNTGFDEYPAFQIYITWRKWCWLDVFATLTKSLYNSHKAMKITRLFARQILDSRGNPTVETDLQLADGSFGRASVPSGASTGTHEVLELRDGDPKAYLGKGVLKAVENVNTHLRELFVGSDIYNQALLDKKMLDLDGTENKSHLGANAVLSVSLAYAKACASSLKLPFYGYLNSLSPGVTPSLPMPMMNIINGGAHADFASDIQEFMIMPVGAKTFSEALRMGSEVFHHLKDILKKTGYETTVGDEGGFAPRVKNGNRESLELVSRAVSAAGYQLGKDIAFALDIAASEFYKDGHYELKADGKSLSGSEMISYLENLVANYPIQSIEDGLSEDDWENWSILQSTLGNRIQIVGDDLLVTNVRFLQKAIDQKACNAILVKLNQIGTLTETISAISLATGSGFHSIISHRSGETEDTSITHLAVGLGTGQIKTGSLSRTERVGKYNELLRIEEELGSGSVFSYPY